MKMRSYMAGYALAGLVAISGVASRALANGAAASQSTTASATDGTAVEERLYRVASEVLAKAIPRKDTLRSVVDSSAARGAATIEEAAQALLAEAARVAESPEARAHAAGLAGMLLLEIGAEEQANAASERGIDAVLGSGSKTAVSIASWYQFAIYRKTWKQPTWGPRTETSKRLIAAVDHRESTAVEVIERDLVLMDGMGAGGGTHIFESGTDHADIPPSVLLDLVRRARRGQRDYVEILLGIMARPDASADERIEATSLWLDLRKEQFEDDIGLFVVPCPEGFGPQLPIDERILADAAREAAGPGAVATLAVSLYEANAPKLSASFKERALAELATLEETADPQTLQAAYVAVAEAGTKLCDTATLAVAADGIGSLPPESISPWTKRRLRRTPVRVLEVIAP